MIEQVSLFGIMKDKARPTNCLLVSVSHSRIVKIDVDWRQNMFKVCPPYPVPCLLSTISYLSEHWQPSMRVCVCSNAAHKAVQLV